jgi:signal transduction histidine kinase
MNSENENIISETLHSTTEINDSFERRRVKLLASISGLLALYLWGAYSGVLEGKALSWWSDFFWTFASLATGWRCLQTAKSRPMVHEQKAWYFFGYAAIAWFAGMLIWDYFEIFENTLVPFPSLSDWFFMGYAPFFILGLMYYRTQMPSRQNKMIQIANLGLIICTIIVLCFILLSQPLAQSENPLAYELYALSHSILTIVCFVFGIYCYWFYIWRKNRHSFRLMLAAVLVFAITDTLYAFQLLGQSFDATSYLNVYWIVGFALHYWAAFEQDTVTQTPSQETDARGTPRAQKYEAIMPALCLFIVLIFSLHFDEQLTETTFTVMTLAAIAFAFFLTLREWHSNNLENTLMKEIKTANMQLEQRVQQRTIELSHAIQELEAFSYSVSHDLRAPLRGIDGFSQALLEDYSEVLDDTGRDFLQRVRAGTQKMSELIDAMLTLSRVSRHTTQRKIVVLNNIAKDIIQQLREQNPERQVDITLVENMTTTGDEHLLRIVLENLLGNAWKYTNKIKHAQIEFGVKQQDGQPVFYVKDNGAGFDMQYANKAFDAFQRLHGAEFEGTGIGLATVQRCIRRLGGTIWAEAEVDGGATFFFTLPTADSA